MNKSSAKGKSPSQSRSRSRDHKDAQDKKIKKDKEKSQKKFDKKEDTLDIKAPKGAKAASNNNEIQPQEGEEVEPQKPKFTESDLIQSLQQQNNYMMEKYNEIQAEQKRLEQEQLLKEQKEKALKEARPTRAGGVYVPPHKLKQLQQEMMESDQNSLQHQRLMWELLRKSINAIVNKVNVNNIQYIIVELLNENILQGKGLLARAIIKSQMSSPTYTHIYAALIAVINTKLPEIVNLIIRRVIQQFQKSYQRNNKIVCLATIKMIAHLINQRVLTDVIGLELLLMLLEMPTEDTVELACEFMTECGQVLTDITPGGVNAIFERFKSILHQGEIDKRVQYSIENLFAIRQTKFKEHPGIIAQLDLVEEDDQIIHNFELTEEFDGQEGLNLFQFDPFFDKTESEWESIKREILGEENILQLKEIRKNASEEEVNEQDQEPEQFTDEDRINLRRTLYLTIMSSMNHEEVLHKIIKMNIGAGHEDEISNMILDCCMNERTYMRFYGLMAQRFCELSDVFRDHFMKCFVDSYATIHRYDTAKIRNASKFFAHLFYTDAVDWRVLKCITLTQDATTASSRIFFKNFIIELCQNLGLANLNERFNQEEHIEYFQGLFPSGNPRDTKFAINFYTSCGVGALTQGLRLVHEKQTQEYMQSNMMAMPQQEDESNNEESDSSSSDSSSSSSESSSESEQIDQKQPAPSQKESDSHQNQNQATKQKIPIEREKEEKKERDRGKQNDRVKEQERQREQEKDKPRSRVEQNSENWGQQEPFNRDHRTQNKQTAPSNTEKAKSKRKSISQSSSRERERDQLHNKNRNKFISSQKDEKEKSSRRKKSQSSSRSDSGSSSSSSGSSSSSSSRSPSEKQKQIDTKKSKYSPPMAQDRMKNLDKKFRR